MPPRKKITPELPPDLPVMLIEKMVWIEVGKLKRYPDNPRIGNRKAIAEAIKAVGYAKVIQVQKSTMFVLDGNHTHQCATELGYAKLPCVLLDVDDEKAAKIVLGANRIGDTATYDPTSMHTVMASAGGWEGTGYSEYDFVAVDSAIGTLDMSNLDSVINPVVVMYEESGLQAAQVVQRITEAKEEPGVFEDADDDLYGSITLKPRDGFAFDTVGYWDFPKLHDDMLMQADDIPPDLKAWAGSATKNYEDDDQWWLYTVGVDSTSGIRDLSKIIVAFYAYDHYFDKFWDHPERWVAKMINSGIGYAVTPDWSHWGNRPRIEGLFNLYKQRFIGRYMQDAGIKIIPNVAIIDVDYFDEVVRPTLPDHLPVICIQLQAIERDITPAEMIQMKAELVHIIESCNADLTLVYAGVTGGRVIQEVIEAGLTNPVQVIEARRIALDAQALKRRKKKTL